MEQPQGVVRRSGRLSLHDRRLIAIGATVLAVVSPLYIDQKSLTEEEFNEESFKFSSYLPVLLLLLMAAIAVSGFWERSQARFDPYWIHRAGGSSTGILLVLIVLAFILKCKATNMHAYSHTDLVDFL